MPADAPANFSAAPGEEGSRQLELRTREGRDVLVAYAPIPTLDWRVFVEVRREEVLVPVLASMYRTGAVLLVGLILSVLASVVMARRMVRPIRALQEGAAQIGAGNLQQQIVVKTGDELEARADQFNTMAVELKESYGGLERKVLQIADVDAPHILPASAAHARKLGYRSTSIAPLLRVEHQIAVEAVGELTLKGISRPLPAFNVTGVKA